MLLFFSVTILFLSELLLSYSKLFGAECETLAKNDGFESFDEFLDWFNQDFVGGVIFWSNFEEKNQWNIDL